MNLFVSEQAHPAVKAYLASMGHLVEVRDENCLYPAVATHADLYHCIVGGRAVSGLPAGPEYPDNVGFCGVQLGNWFVHNLKLTAPQVRSAVNECKLQPIHVKQGYTRCNLLPLAPTQPVGGDTSIRPAAVTSDGGIARALEGKDIDILLIQPGYVALPGHPYGFLPGAAGQVEDQVIFHGNVNDHPEGGRLRKFIEERGLKLTCFPELVLTDIGSILAEDGISPRNPRR